MFNLDEVNQILAKLIAFNTISAESNLECIDYIENFLKQSHFRTHRIYNEEKTKANLIASVGPEGPGGIVLSGHSDVVPVAGQAWKSNPFEMTIINENYHGRGTSDMKGFIALAMLLASNFANQNLQAPLHIVISYDEEIGCLGAKHMQNQLVELIQNPLYCIIGEPTNLDIVIAHKGIQVSKTQIEGIPAHSSAPQLGASSILTALEIIDFIRNNIPNEHDDTFEPSYSTFNIGTIQGGNAVNIIPQHCEFNWEVRPLPSVDINEFNIALNAHTESYCQQHDNITIKHSIEAFVPGFKSGDNLKIGEQLQQHLSNCHITTAAFTTEAGIFQQAGIPTIVCGPGHINQAHQPNERVELIQYQRCYKFLEKAIESLL